MKAKFLNEYGKDGLAQEYRENGCFRELKYEVMRIRGNREIGQPCRSSRKKKFQLFYKETQNSGFKDKAKYSTFHEVLLNLI